MTFGDLLPPHRSENLLERLYHIAKNGFSCGDAIIAIDYSKMDRLSRRGKGVRKAPVVQPIDLEVAAVLLSSWKTEGEGIALEEYLLGHNADSMSIVRERSKAKRPTRPKGQKSTSTEPKGKQPEREIEKEEEEEEEDEVEELKEDWAKTEKCDEWDKDQKWDEGWDEDDDHNDGGVSSGGGEALVQQEAELENTRMRVGSGIGGQHPNVACMAEQAEKSVEAEPEYLTPLGGSEIWQQVIAWTLEAPRETRDQFCRLFQIGGCSLAEGEYNDITRDVRRQVGIALKNLTNQ